MAKEKDIVFDNEFFTSVLDCLYTYIFIADMETDEIVYMNANMKKLFHLEDPRGCVCWQVLQKGMEKRCSFCKNKELEAGKKVSVWNEVNTITGRSYKCYDSVIKWEGRIYHIHNSTDITEYVRISETARIDELTQLLNRRAGKEKLLELIEKAKREQKVITVGMYDINELKQVNDSYGHIEGDHLIRYISEIVKQSLNREDMIFRLSGDEFILALYDEKLSFADWRIRHVQKRLIEESGHHKIFYEASFSIGLVEVYPGDNYTISEIIDKADEQMYIQKRSYHIRRAKQRLLTEKIESTVAKQFEYDTNHLYEALAASTDDFVFVGNMKTGIFQYSPSMVKEFGLPGMVVENAAAFWGKLIHPQDEKGFLESNQEIADGRAEKHRIEYRAKNVRGEWVWLRCRGRMVRDKAGQPDLFAGFISMLGENIQIDHITGISNRFTFEGNIKEYTMEEETITQMGIMILDMDNFKNVNDLYSRSFGDAILRETAQRISVILPLNASIYRLDGDEFGVIIINGREEEYLQIYQSIQSKFQKQQEHDSKKYYCTISAGYAVYPKDADNYQDLLKYSNLSLEHSKLNGKNRITRFLPEILQEKERKLELVVLLRESIDRGFVGFSISYQPQIDFNTRQLYGAEALARWSCEKYGDVSPKEFIPLLEQNGLILPFGSWILNQAARQCKEWCVVKPDFHMSVNISYIQMLEGDIVTEIAQMLQNVGLSSANLTLELAEIHLIKEETAAQDVMKRLHELGIELAIDDLETGYSSLFSLKHVPVDLVKIDREFVKDIATNFFNTTFVRAISELCHEVGKKVCLEGVETQEEYDAVKSIGLERFQGYYFGFPIQAGMFEKRWL